MWVIVHAHKCHTGCRSGVSCGWGIRNRGKAIKGENRGVYIGTKWAGSSMGSQFFQLRYIICEFPNSIPPESWYQVKSIVRKKNQAVRLLNLNKALYLRSSSCIRAKSLALRIWSKWINRAFHTPSSNSCMRSTTSIGKKSNPCADNLSEKAF